MLKELPMIRVGERRRHESLRDIHDAGEVAASPTTLLYRQHSRQSVPECGNLGCAIHRRDCSTEVS